MRYADVTLAVPSCVYPAGLKRLLDSVWASEDHPGRVVICLDGNEGWQRLDQMEDHRELFSAMDRRRLDEANREVSDYSFLNGRGGVEVIRNRKNLGAVGAFNRCFEACYMDGYAVLINDDATVLPGWIGVLVAVMQQRPKCVITGFSNQDVSARLGFADLPRFCHMGACCMMRGTYLRELINQVGSVDDGRFKMFKSDSQRLCAPAGRGHDVVCVASPMLLAHEEHISLGDWVAEACRQDQGTDIQYPVNNGARGRNDLVGRYRFVKVDPQRRDIVAETP